MISNGAALYCTLEVLIKCITIKKKIINNNLKLKKIINVLGRDAKPLRLTR